MEDLTPDSIGGYAGSTQRIIGSVSEVFDGLVADHVIADSFGALIGGGVIKSLQTGSIFLNDADQSGTATISSVDTAKAFVLPVGNSLGESNVDTFTEFGSKVVLTNATTVTASRQFAPGSAASGVHVAFLVIELN